MRDSALKFRAVWWCASALFLSGDLLIHPTFAAPVALASSADSTATELLRDGLGAYDAGDFATARAKFEKFIADFGRSAETAPAIPQILPLLALSEIHLEKWDNASKTITLFLATHAAKAPAATVEDMRFWEGVSLLRQNQNEEARAKLEAFITAFPKSARLGEGRLMAGITYVMAKDFKNAGPYFAKIESLLSAEQRSRAILLELHSRVQSQEKDEALRLVVEAYPNLSKSTQIAGFELLTLQLGSDFLAAGEYRKAIVALQRVWSADRIKKHSEEKLAALKADEATAAQRRLDPAATFELQQNIGKVNSDLQVIGEMENFDSSLQLRLASAYQGMKRYREAAILMGRMLAEMPPDPIVEKASVNLVQCWAQIGRWPKAIESADTFAKSFPASSDLPLVLLLKGQSLSADQRYPEAIAVYDDVVKRFPTAAITSRCLFMKGYTQLINQENTAGLASLDSFAEKYPKDPLNDTVFYWRGMGVSLSGQPEKAREILAAYLDKYPAGEHIAEARFRRAYDAQAQKQYDISIAELRSYLTDFARNPSADDARLLLGDALMAKGKVDEGIQVLRAISPADPTIFENGYFKIAKALRLQEKPDEMRAHLEKFISEHPKSNRVAEATYWIGWSWRQADQIDKARDIYWQGIENLGNDPKSTAVEDLLTGVAKLYKGDDQKAQLLTRFRDLESDATAKKRNTLAVRALWAQAQIIKKADPAASQAFLLKTVPLIDVRILNPQLLADAADALQKSGKTPEAVAMYRDLIKWNPRAVQRDRAFAGLGQIALAAGQEKEALDYFNRFEKESFGSPLFGEILLAKALLEKKRGATDEAQATLEKILANKFAGSKAKAEALCIVGDLLLDNDPAKAVPYYQKTYVMYGRWTGFVARAYLGSGAAFEKLNNRDAAIKTYQEMAAKPELADSKELAEARTRLARLEAGA